MKRIAILTVALFALAFGVACSGSDSGSDKYHAYLDKYGPVFEDLGEAFGGDAYDPNETYEQWASNLTAEDCTPIEGEDAALGMVFFQPLQRPIQRASPDPPASRL